VTGFFDTNVLVYAFSDGPKREPAREALAAGGMISAQVLNEFTNLSRRKQKREWTEIEAALAVIRARFPKVALLTAETHTAALVIARDHHGFAFYDALIVAAAIEAGCDTLFTEDMQDGRAIGGLTIRNPFKTSAP
jgi:predicted nucleic acid-binding protein